MKDPFEKSNVRQVTLDNLKDFKPYLKPVPIKPLSLQINQPQSVQIKIGRGGKDLWVRIDGKTRLRLSNIEPGTPFSIEGLYNAELTAYE